MLQHAAMSLDLVRDIKKEEKLLAHIEDLVRSTGEAGDDLRNSPDSDDQVGKQVTVPLCTLTKSTQSNTNILLPGPLFSERYPGDLSLRRTIPLTAHPYHAHTHNSHPVRPLNRADAATHCRPPPSLPLSLSSLSPPTTCRRCSGWKSTCWTASGCITR